jgi:hypothetical protein
MNVLRCSALLSLALLCGVCHADKEDLQSLQPAVDHDWYVVKKDDTRHITTYAKNEDGKSIRSFKIEARIDASLATLAGVHFDVANIKKWYWETLESKLISKVSDTEYIYYMKFNTPLAPDRDVVIHATIEPYQDSHKYMLLRLRGEPSILPVPDGVTRLTAFDIDIKFTPLVNGETQMDIQGYIDPSGGLPAWTVNMFQRQAPYATMLGLYRMVQKPEYARMKTPLAFRYSQ